MVSIRVRDLGRFGLWVCRLGVGLVVICCISCVMDLFWCGRVLVSSW